MKKFKIEIKGQLNKHWAECFENMTFSYNGDNTILTGYVADQSALHGLLNRIRDLNLTLISVNSNINQN